jgi:isocitrate/isopropylmalate dehydrogenase
MGAITSKPEAEAARELAPRLRDQGLRYRSPIVRLRQELDLFAGLRPARAWPGVPCAHPGYRYPDSPRVNRGPVLRDRARRHRHVEHAAMIHYELANASASARSGRVALSARVTTEHASRRIVRVAFQQARTPQSRAARQPKV